MKRHLYKFLLSTVRALVSLKRLFVWFGRGIGRFFGVVTRPAIPLVIAPLYQLSRRHWRRYLEISSNPWERRRVIVTSRLGLIFFTTVITLLITYGSVRASSQPGVIPGSKSFLLAHLSSSSSDVDWQAATDDGLSTDTVTEQIPTTIYHNGGAIAYVFPYSGAVGRAPASISDQTSDQMQIPPKQTQPIQRYAVQRGDTLARIAKKFNLKIATLLWANNLVANSVLRPGDTITVPSVDGVVYAVKSGGTVKNIATVFKVDAKIIAAANNVSVNTSLKKGQLIVVPGAQPLTLPKPVATPSPAPEPAPVPDEAPQVADATPADQPAASSDQSDVPTDVEPPPQTTTEVIKRPPLAPGEKLLWPTRNHSVTQYFSAGHPGDDINGDYTDPVYAADDGTVVFSGWNNGGYGNMILIDHGNGMQTRYGHNSKVFVHVGQQVSRGETISMVGTTGRSTGTHLHFEVIIGGRHVNPLKYIR
ncbi:MAG: M23 family metallopeptidase [Candidatus Magasanikbacteria bacterium]|nr:M23 family metallopeptidase [Candidatus Magasanikbacteria bacterium]